VRAAKAALAEPYAHKRISRDDFKAIVGAVERRFAAADDADAASGKLGPAANELSATERASVSEWALSEVRSLAVAR
jgi:hypothetical protein